MFWNKRKELNQADKNRALNQELKKSWDNARQAAGLTTFDLAECYESAKGHIYYRFVNILDITEVRHFEMQKASKAISLGVDDNYLDALEAEIKQAANKGDTAKILGLVQDLNYRRKSLPEEKQFLKMGLLFIVRHDENPYTFNAVSEADKIKDMSEDPELRSFFLAIAWDLASSLIQAKLKDLELPFAIDFQDFLKIANNKSIV